ncbi:NAD(P)/FAD-dependent oxidoreductase [uncultured Sphingomonas sp.]|uniref:NAD(P)/FAD-dependent oxidoreductase n=1 Tax=uncultured Sphingomonas sp. TaxID=158754 RepID=UPI0035CA9500
MAVAIIGAGIAGLSCATRLQETGHHVTLFDKGRAAGGRMSTRSVATVAGVFSFDHGAQYLTARDPEFRSAIDDWEAHGVVAPWPAAGANAWVGTPGMSAIVRHLAADVDVRWGTCVESIDRTEAEWRLYPRIDGCYDAVILAIPAEQAAPLLAPHDPSMASEALACRSAPCWTVMLAFDLVLKTPGDIIRDAGIIGWAARDVAKPGRSGAETWVIQATPDWSKAHLEDSAELVIDRLVAAFAEHVAGRLPDPLVRIAHRWRYARVAASDLGSLWNAEERLGAAGDWLLGPRVESAWLSGRQLADRILEDHTLRPV